MYLDSCSFVRWGELNEESLEEDVNKWLYREEEENTTIKLPLDQYGNGFKMLQRHDYNGTTGLGE